MPNHFGDIGAICNDEALAFLHSYVGNPPQVRVRGLGENDVEEPLAPSAFQMPTDWSPDGRFIVFENTGIARLSSEIQSDVLMFKERALRMQFEDGRETFVNRAGVSCCIVSRGIDDAVWFATMFAKSGGPSLRDGVRTAEQTRVFSDAG
jgi:hypothetical protein